jgi:hypothetical protein
VRNEKQNAAGITGSNWWPKLKENKPANIFQPVDPVNPVRK